MSSKSIFHQVTPAGQAREIRQSGFDSVLVSSPHAIGQINGMHRRIPAICMNAATDEDLWWVVNVKTQDGYDAIAVLGAVDSDQAQAVAQHELGYMFDSLMDAQAFESKHQAIMRHLDSSALHVYKSPLRKTDIDRLQDVTTTQKAMWDGIELLSHSGSSAILRQDLVRNDDDNQLLDALTPVEFVRMQVDAGAELLGYDSIVVAVNKLDVLMQRLNDAMSKATSAGGLTVTQMTKSDPFKRNKVTQVAVIFDLSDGQSVTVVFHNPDNTPAKLTPTDTLISWKFMLNKRDVTAAVMPNQADDVKLPELAVRIMKVANANSASFKRANKRKAEVVQAIADTTSQLDAKKQQVVDLDTEIAQLQAELDKPVEPPAPEPDVQLPAPPKPEPKIPPVGFSGVWDTEDGSQYPFQSVRPEGIASFATREEAEAHYQANTSVVNSVSDFESDKQAAIWFTANLAFILSSNPRQAALKAKAIANIDQILSGLDIILGEYQQSLADVQSGKVSGTKIVGSGYGRNTKSVAIEWINSKIGENQTAVYDAEKLKKESGSTTDMGDSNPDQTTPPQEPTMPPSNANPDAEYLQSVVNGTADLSVAGDELERIGGSLPTELEDLFEQAAEAYAQYAIGLEV